ADDNDVVGPVAHDLQLELLPADDRFLDQDLPDRAEIEPVGDKIVELLTIVDHAAAGAAQGKTGAEDARQADLFADGLRLGKAPGQPAPRNRQPDLDHGVLELLPV